MKSQEDYRRETLLLRRLQARRNHEAEEEEAARQQKLPGGPYAVDAEPKMEVPGPAFQDKMRRPDAAGGIKGPDDLLEGIVFASAKARELAVAATIDATDFAEFGYGSGKDGAYTAADVRGIIGDE